MNELRKYLVESKVISDPTVTHELFLQILPSKYYLGVALAVGRDLAVIYKMNENGSITVLDETRYKNELT